MNLYTYVHNNPLIYHDPTGHFVMFLPIVIPAIVAKIGLGAAVVGAGVYVGNEISEANKSKVSQQPPITQKKPTISEQPIIQQKPVVIQARGPYNWANQDTLQDHYERHASDFNISNPNQYAYEANRFFINKGKYQNKTDVDGTIRVFDPQSNTFGSFNSNGTTRTYLKPTSPTYWQRQPGELK